MNRFTFGSIASAALALCVSTVASAQEQQQALTANRPQIGATLGYGIYVGEDAGDTDFNIYGLALGVHGGYTLEQNVFVGGFFNYFLGESEDAEGLEVSANVMQIAADVGYDLGLDAIIVRPSLGLGLAIAMANTSGSFAGMEIDESDSETELMLAPGARVMVPLEQLYVGGELRYFWMPGEDHSDGFLIAFNIGALL